MIVLRNLLIVLSVATSFNSIAQIYHFRNYSEENGLHQSYIYNISQTQDGFLSLATGEGYCLFDGINFTTFTTKEISENFVTTHFINSKNIPWIGYAQNGIAYIKNGKVNSIKDKRINNHKITHIDENKDGTIWISTAGAGFVCIDTVLQIKIRDINNVKNVNGFQFDARNNILAATTEGLVLIWPKTLLTTKINEFTNKNIKQIIKGNEPNVFWLIAEGEGIYGIKYNGHRYVVFKHILEELNSKTYNISTIYSDKIGNLWVSVFGEGLRKITFSNTVNNSFNVKSIDQENGLKNLYIQSIFQDFEGNMWFGTFGAGLIEIPIEKFSYFNEKDGLQQTDIKKVAIDKKGMLWLASNSGIQSFNTYSKVSQVFNASKGFINDKVNTVIVDKSGLLWIGTNDNGIYTLNTSTLKFENFSKKHKLTQQCINTIIEDRTGNIIAGTNEGLCYYNKQLDSVNVITMVDGLLHNNVLSLFNDSKNRLWISSHGSNPYYIKDLQFTNYKDIKELKTFNINCITEDKNGIIWIATEGDGVFKYNGKSFVNYKTENGLLSNYCYGIVIDNYNSIWVMHKNGLSEKKPSIKDFTCISSNEGLLMTENNLNSFHKDSIGSLWFGTTKGLIRYNSDVGKTNSVEPKLSIYKIKLNKVTYTANDKIEEKFGYYLLHIDFLAVSLINPEKIKYKYRLLGIDSIWKVTNSTFVDFSNLSGGDYVFQVMACNSEGLWTSQPVEVIITIKQPIWKKIWFYPLLIILVILVTYLIIYWRTNNLRKAQLLLQKKVKEKTFLLEKEKEESEIMRAELEHRNKDITDSINYARRIQDSLLPPEEILSELFENNYFICYKPKDIVSGDFYWAAKTNTSGANSKKLSLAAVADCTGHGVPGAFLSIVATNFLKQSLTEQSVNNPAEALDFLNENITSNLNQSSKLKNRMRDGMDMAMIAIDYANYKLYYSGANNSIYIYRNIQGEIQIHILKPTKRAIGSGLEYETKYELQNFDLQNGDTIYLFSDGYADQFGGEKDKKLNYKRFKEILAQAALMPMVDQCKFLDERFEAWRGNTEQTDDVCVMGIRI